MSFINRVDHLHVLSVREVARMLRVNVKVVYDAIRRGEIPARRIGRRRIVIPKTQLLEWLAQGRVSPSEEDDE